MKKTIARMAFAAAVVSASLGAMGEREARACGGCFPPPGENNSVVTDHRMILTISPQQTTLYDQIRYSGNPSSFAWVLPISGEAKVGVSSDSVFGALETLSQTTVVAPNPNCPGAPTDCPVPLNAPTADAAGAEGVQVTKQETVGPYETVQLRSTDPNALNDWLVSNGYAISDDIKPTVAQYVAEHFDFLAIKLVPGKTVSAMRPIRVTTAGASPILPLRMVAAGTGNTVGITLWVVGDGRWEPQNFSFFHVENSEITWDWSKSQSDYRTLRAAKSEASAGKAWEIESSLSLSTWQVKNAIQFSRTPNGQPDYLPVTGSGGSVVSTPDQERDADLATLFAGVGNGDTFRLTRLRADLARPALADDLQLRAAADQTVLSNIRLAEKELGEPQCPIYQGCDVSRNGTRSEAVAAAAARKTGNVSSFTCSTGADSTPRYGLAGITGAFLGLLGAAFLRARRRRSS